MVTPVTNPLQVQEQANLCNQPNHDQLNHFPEKCIPTLRPMPTDDEMNQPNPPNARVDARAKTTQRAFTEKKRAHRVLALARSNTPTTPLKACKNRLPT